LLAAQNHFAAGAVSVAAPAAYSGFVRHTKGRDTMDAVEYGRLVEAAKGRAESLRREAIRELGDGLASLLHAAWARITRRGPRQSLWG
jgi:Ser/Thr protein kinase RdoA (MazF antagonist)